MNTGKYFTLTERICTPAHDWKKSKEILFRKCAD